MEWLREVWTSAGRWWRRAWLAVIGLLLLGVLLPLGVRTFWPAFACQLAWYREPPSRLSFSAPSR